MMESVIIKNPEVTPYTVGGEHKIKGVAVRSIFRNISVSCVFDQFVETYFQSDRELYWNLS
jgi:hypothetical protein